MTTHPPTPSQFPQNRAETLNASDEVLSAMMGYCDIEPADPDVCNMCLAYMEMQKREEALKERFDTDPLFQLALCKRCHLLIMKIGMLNGKDWWTHIVGGFALYSGVVRGCRAASFDADDGWDDTLDRHWTASPDKRFDVVREKDCLTITPNRG